MVTLKFRMSHLTEPTFPNTMLYLLTTLLKAILKYFEWSIFTVWLKKNETRKKGKYPRNNLERVVIAQTSKDMGLYKLVCNIFTTIHTKS